MGRSRIVVVVSLVAGLIGAAAPAAGAVTDRSSRLTPARGSLPAPEPCVGCWAPDPSTSWQWQLQGEIDTSVDVQMYDVDGFEVSAGTVQGVA